MRLLAALVLGGVMSAMPATARTWHVPAAPGAATSALRQAVAGDTVLLGRGMHPGPLEVHKSIFLRGEPGAVVDGGGKGSVITVHADHAVVEDLLIRGSGRSTMETDAGIEILISQHVRISRIAMDHVLYGIYVERSGDLGVRDVRLVGSIDPAASSIEHASMDAAGGNGIHLWYSPDARIVGADLSHFADAVYLSFAHGAHVDGSLLHDNARYGLHTMYCQDGQLRKSRFTRNAAGCAIMFSNHLRVEGNSFVFNQGSRTYGLLLRDCSDGVFRDNRIVANTIGVFLDNSNRNRFEGNLLQEDGWGVLLYASCAGNVFARNNFIQCDYPVALDMRRTRNSFDDGVQGNHWSDHAGYDLDGDGVSDQEYSPVSAFAFLSKQSPDLTLLARSPAVLALTAAERVFPALRPSEAVDRFPSVSALALPLDSAVVDTAAPSRHQRPRTAVAAAALFAVVGLASGWGLLTGGRST